MKGVYWLRGQIILTTNYDDVLERAFEQAGEPFDLLSYSSEEQRSGMFIHTPPGGKPCVIENPNYYHDLRSKRTDSNHKNIRLSEPFRSLSGTALLSLRMIILNN